MYLQFGSIRLARNVEAFLLALECFWLEFEFGLVSDLLRFWFEFGAFSYLVRPISGYLVFG